MYIYKAKKNDKGDRGEWKLGEELIYWRKANQIRKWIVDNLGYNEDADCEFFPIDKDDFENLIFDITKILECNKNERHVMAESIMPTSSGFFFGGTEYDEWYFKDLEYTKDEVQKVIDNWDELIRDGSTIGYYEWW